MKTLPIKDFYDMDEFPVKSKDEPDYSIDVIIYESPTYFVLGFYHFKDKAWHIHGDESMKLHCWSFAPVPMETMFSLNPEAEFTKHVGYC